MYSSKYEHMRAVNHLQSMLHITLLKIIRLLSEVTSGSESSPKASTWPAQASVVCPTASSLTSGHTTFTFAPLLCPHLWNLHLPFSLPETYVPRHAHGLLSWKKADVPWSIWTSLANLHLTVYKFHTHLLITLSLLHFSSQHLFHLKYYVVEWNLKWTGDWSTCWLVFQMLKLVWHTVGTQREMMVSEKFWQTKKETKWWISWSPGHKLKDYKDTASATDQPCSLIYSNVWLALAINPLGKSCTENHKQSEEAGGEQRIMFLPRPISIHSTR